jgi:hypothetical protein
MMAEFIAPTDPVTFAFRAFGSTLRIESNDTDLLDDIRVETNSALIGKLEYIDPGSAIPDRVLGVYLDGEAYRLYEDGEESTHGTSRRNFIKFYNAIVRVAVGEHAENLVFLHAGAVAWNEKAIVMPAHSFSGKTTLVAELVKLGAVYYSDEYAVIDADGRVNPYERDLSVRFDGGRSEHTLIPVETIGGKAGVDPVPIGMLLLTTYDPNACFQPKRLTLGEAIVGTIPFAIPVLKYPERTIKHLQTAFEHSICLSSARGDAARTAVLILDLLNNDG